MSFKERKLEAEVKMGLRKAIVVEVPKEEEVVSTPKVVKEDPMIEVPKKKVAPKKKSKND